MIVIFPDEVGVSIMQIAESCPLPIEAVARKDVPAGIPYRIVADDFFKDQENDPREEWTADFENPDGYGSKEYGAGSGFDVMGYDVEGDALIVIRKNIETEEHSECKA